MIVTLGGYAIADFLWDAPPDKLGTPSRVGLNSHGLGTLSRVGLYAHGLGMPSHVWLYAFTLG